MIENALDSLDLVMEYYSQSIYHPKNENRLNKIIIIFFAQCYGIVIKKYFID